MISIEIIEEAKRDLVDIWRYTQKAWGAEQADRYLDQLDEGIKLISRNAALEHSFSEIHVDLFFFHCQHHYLFYLRKENETLKIIAVLHEQMDLLKRLRTRIMKLE